MQADHRKWVVMRIQAIVLGILAILGGCGYVGDTLPPALYIPLPVQDLSAMQEGGDILVRFTPPVRSTEDLPLKDAPEIELRAAIWENREWDDGAWEREALALPVMLEADAAVAHTPVNGFIGRRLLMRVRAAGPKQRFSSWSEPVALRVLAAQPEPTAIEATPTAAGVAINWSLPEADESSSPRVIEVWRRLGDQEEFLLVGTPSAGPFVDAGSVFGEAHSYRLRTRVVGEEQLALSHFSAVVNVLPVDVFPPTAPTGLIAIAAASSIELSWPRNAEPDLASYQVYRAVADGDFVPIGNTVTSSTFSDPSAPTDQAVRYRITARDHTGNESEPSETVEVTRPQ